MPHGVYSLLSLTDGAIYRFICHSHPSTRAKERVERNCIWTDFKQLALIFAGGTWWTNRSLRCVSINSLLMLSSVHKR